MCYRILEEVGILSVCSHYFTKALLVLWTIIDSDFLKNGEMELYFFVEGQITSVLSLNSFYLY